MKVIFSDVWVGSNFLRQKIVSFFVFPLVVFFLVFFSCTQAAALSKNRQTVAPGEASDYIIIKHKTAQDIFEDANYLYSAGKYEKAISLYNYAYDISQERGLKRKILAQKKKAKRSLARQEKKRKEDAKKAKVRAKRDKKKKINSLYKQALADYSKNKLDEAKEGFEQILIISPQEKEAKFFIDKKIPLKRKQIELAKKKEAEKNLALQEKKREEDAKKFRARVKRDKEEKIKSLYKQAVADYSKNKLDEAKEGFEQILAISPYEKRGLKLWFLPIRASSLTEKAKLYIDKKIPAKRKQIERRMQKKQRSRNKKRGSK